jgi:hypothetical protein
MGLGDAGAGWGESWQAPKLGAAYAAYDAAH